MARNRVGEGARALLFERLVDESPRTHAEVRPFRTHDPEGLRESVLRRLDQLLNTRSARPRPEEGPLTVLDYGLPDYSAMYTRAGGAQAFIAREIVKTIEAFEPRLQNPVVTLSRVSHNDHTLSVAISGRLRGEDIIEPVAFTIPLSGDGAGKDSS